MRLRRKADGPDKRLPYAATHHFLGCIALFFAGAGKQKGNIADIEGMEEEPAEALARYLDVADFNLSGENDGKAQQASNDGSRNKIVLEELHFGLQKRADEEHQRRYAEENEVFKSTAYKNSFYVFFCLFYKTGFLRKPVLWNL